MLFSAQAAFLREAFAEDDNSARNPEVLGSYEIGPDRPQKRSGEFSDAIRLLNPSARNFCDNLLKSQMSMMQVNESWKLHSLYEAMGNSKLMTGTLVRVPIVAEIVESMPRYSGYKRVLAGAPQGDLQNLKDIMDGDILVSAVGSPCGPDRLAPKKGSYFLKCGKFLIGSGLLLSSDYGKLSCSTIKVLRNRSLADQR